MSQQDFELHLQQAKRAIREATKLAQTMGMPHDSLNIIDDHLVAALCSVSAVSTVYAKTHQYALSARQEVENEFARKPR